MIQVLTTGDVSRICGFSQQTAIRCIDEGLIEGAYFVPLSRHRRVPRSALYKFMRDTGISGNGEQLFTTGEVARICGLSQAKIIKCFDAKKLGGFRIPIRGRFRLIPWSAVKKFLENYDIPANNLPVARKLCENGGEVDCNAEQLILGV